MNDIVQTLRRYLESTLGKIKSSYFQLKVCCPSCDKGLKFNLEININANSEKYLLFKCWSCGYSGFIRKLLEDYSVDPSWKVLPEFKSKNYAPQNLKKKQEPKVLFPEHTVPYYLNEQVEKYLIEGRRMKHVELHRRNVRYCFSPADKYYNHILFPFYDHQGTLVAFCAQNFDTKKYKNIGALSFVPYEEFINPLFPIVITEGIYDSLSGPNAIPLLGTNINHAIFRFCQDKKIILALDNDKEVTVETKKQYIKKLYVYGATIVVIFELEEYKDLNDFWCKDQPEMRNRMKVMFELLNMT